MNGFDINLTKSYSKNTHFRVTRVHKQPVTLLQTVSNGTTVFTLYLSVYFKKIILSFCIIPLLDTVGLVIYDHHLVQITLFDNNWWLQIPGQHLKFLAPQDYK